MRRLNRLSLYASSIDSELPEVATAPTMPALLLTRISFMSSAILDHSSLRRRSRMKSDARSAKTSSRMRSSMALMTAYTSSPASFEMFSTQSSPSWSDRFATRFFSCTFSRIGAICREKACSCSSSSPEKIGAPSPSTDACADTLPSLLMHWTTPIGSPVPICPSRLVAAPSSRRMGTTSMERVR